jgi:aminoglycoside phosphotransferase (APT) family kinase protein
MVVEKADMTPELVSRLVATQFPQWAELPVRPVDIDGWDNATFRLGEHMSVRLPSSQAYVEQVDKEQRWLPILAPQLPLPAATEPEDPCRPATEMHGSATIPICYDMATE